MNLDLGSSNSTVASWEPSYSKAFLRKNVLPENGYEPKNLVGSELYMISSQVPAATGYDK